jgi:hypothetical protein
MPVAGETEEKTYKQEDVDALIAEQTEGLRKNRDEALKEVKAARQRLANYEGVDPDEFKKLKAEKEDAEKKKLAAEGDFKSLETQLVKKYEGELEVERGNSK